MTYLLFFLSIGLATALVVVIKQLQQRQNEYALAQQRLKEADRKIQDIDRKYGGLLSQEESARKLDNQIIVLTDRLKQLNRQANTEEQELDHKISTLKIKLQELEEQEFIESFGFYKSKYDFQESGEYKQCLDKIRFQQKQMIKDRTAAVCRTQFTLSDSRKEGKKMTDSYLRLILRAFNGECDAAVVKVKYSNAQTMENRIRKAFAELNKLSEIIHSEITSDYLDLKLKELWLTHEYQEKKYQEQEEQRTIREQMREEERALRELEKVTQEAEREERRYQEALEKAQREIENVTGKAQQKLQAQIEELQKRVAEAEASKERAISQAQLTKSGHVYVISNIGSFGNDVYKIGMTRRLEPMDRVKELGDASVPFPFDVHAMIFCENAPELESRLHKRFNFKRVNKANGKKEFFRVSLEEVVETVREIDEELQICKSEIKFTKAAEAADFRNTLAQEREVQRAKVT
ncbi:MAG: DUF4041 domain-containing protein [Stenomitos frigidus ULC029]